MPIYGSYLSSTVRTMHKTLTAQHVRAARGLLAWERSQLAKAAGVSAATVKRIELTKGYQPHSLTVAAVRRAIEDADVELLFEPSIGVRFRPTSIDATNPGVIAAEDLNASNDE
jgi:DNA-binding XRE family transcriptional regulator